jgi:hypothetical protein
MKFFPGQGLYPQSISAKFLGILFKPILKWQSEVEKNDSVIPAR